MTPQEQQMLQDLTNRINGTVLPDKDQAAEQYLQQALGRNPDSLYILAQTVLVQQYALEQAKKQLSEQKDQLRQAQQQAAQTPQPVKHTSFLGSLLGGDEPSRPAPPPPPPSPYGQAQYAPVTNYSASQPSPQYAQPQYAQPAFGQSQGGGFLRSAMQTATGVAAGALAFEGIESLMHGFGQHSGYGGGSGFGNFGGDAGGGRPGEVINNYYGDSAGHENGLSSDIEDRRDDGNNSSDRAQFADTSDSSDNDSNDSDTGSDFSDNSGDDSSDNSSSSDDGF